MKSKLKCIGLSYDMRTTQHCTTIQGHCKVNEGQTINVR